MLFYSRWRVLKAKRVEYSNDVIASLKELLKTSQARGRKDLAEHIERVLVIARKERRRKARARYLEKFLDAVSFQREKQSQVRDDRDRICEVPLAQPQKCSCGTNPGDPQKTPVEGHLAQTGVVGRKIPTSQS